MSDLLPFDPKDNQNVIVAVIQKVLSGTGVVITASAVIKSFGGTVRFIENQAGFFVEKQIRISEVRKNFSNIAKALEQGTDSMARNCFNFCMRVHHLPDTESKFKFMGMVTSSFQNNWPGTLERFANLELEIVEHYFSPNGSGFPRR